MNTLSDQFCDAYLQLIQLEEVPLRLVAQKLRKNPGHLYERLYRRSKKQCWLSIRMMSELLYVLGYRIEFKTQTETDPKSFVCILEIVKIHF